MTSSDPYAECLVKFFLFFSSFCSDLFHTCTTHNDALWIYIVLRHCFDVHVLGTIMAVMSRRGAIHTLLNKTVLTKQVQRNLCQKLLFFHQLSHNMTIHRLFIELRVQYMKILSSEHVLDKNCFFILFSF